MPNTPERKGNCLCGAVRFTAKSSNHSVGACHCNMCRKWGGGPYMQVSCGSNVIFENEENISRYNSSKWAERGFCNTCGSHLFYHLKGSSQYMMQVGLFEDDIQRNLVFDRQVFIDEKPFYYSFSNKTNNMTGAEIFEKYTFPPEEQKV